MALISKKKNIYPVSQRLRQYLKRQQREVKLPIQYRDLLRYENSIALLDKKQNDTLWETVFYAQHEMEYIHYSLKKVYAMLKADGDLSVMEHLYVDRIDLCVYGNTQPFRVRVVNRINDNFDYFYLKKADASRVYGLELEHWLSPNRISYLVDNDTLIEQHIIGVPGDQFIRQYLEDVNLNKIRLSKEFVKFNERCFIRLLGDMHANNFVVNITPDFDDVDYRIRAIDFDQQSYEGRKSIYLPQYFKENNPLIQIGLDCLTIETVKQYQKEERSLIARRYKLGKKFIKELLKAMSEDDISKPEYIATLRAELAKHYSDDGFLICETMGALVQKSLNKVLEQKQTYHFPISD
ncbi:hypothetical protein FNH22_10375 [Fulvivirga sp. M361]|uniref:hypothetical protein n=1 Tax=Fulvivirga sp. M361 TaxID=2594266 RepID=UPI00117A40CC|nr:hypothetical protein [Fulvivirga sp. M361]TRX59548.1 hypothetical protein FNH22_10375 [Fulvivirga sp. M361]